MTEFRLFLVESDVTFRTFLANAIYAMPAARASASPWVLDQAASIEDMSTAFAEQTAPYDLAIVNLDTLDVGNRAFHHHPLSLVIKRFPLVSFVGYSASDSLLIPRDAFTAGAAGFFRRDSPPLLIQQVLDIVLGAESFAIPEHFRSGMAIRHLIKGRQ